MAKDVINRTEGLRRQAQEIIEQAYCRGYKDGEAEKGEKIAHIVDDDHIWVDGRQYVSLRRFQEAVKLAFKEGEASAADKLRPKEDELKPCPFCGGHASVMSVPGIDGSTEYIVQCDQCLATTPDYGDAEDAAEAWNRRASDEHTERHNGG